MNYLSLTVLVTGGTGFIGAYIIKNLVNKEIRVRAIKHSAKLPFFIPQEVCDKVEWVDGDILDVVGLNDAMNSINAVIHSAAIVSFAKGQRRLMYEVNVEGTANVINAALNNNVKRFIHISSVAALGRTTKSELINEGKKWEVNKSNTHYAISKHYAEMEAWRGFSEGLAGAIINPASVLGFGNWHRSSCAIFKNVYKGFPWYTSGVNGFVGVEDVAEAAVQLLYSNITNKRFIVNAENWSFQKLFDCIAEGFGRQKPQWEATPFLGNIAWRLEKIKSLLTNSEPLLTRETVRVAHSKTSFDNSALLKALPKFSFSPLEVVIKDSCDKYVQSLKKGLLTL
ncbi:MAG: NAD-dependent epimerase/dehydratase family protein [Chitinophagaceae bacterium]|nr:NAD-dependent epimerase/dehydratase family protein [Chitinophagaceae bacterium]